MMPAPTPLQVDEVDRTSRRSKQPASAESAPNRAPNGKRRAELAGRTEAERLEQSAIDAYLSCCYDESVARWTDAHHAWLQQGHLARAVRCAFWVSFVLIDQGEFAQSSGWLHRGQRLLASSGDDCVERGYLLCVAGLHAVLAQGDPAGAERIFAEAAAIADRFGDADLTAYARVGQGRTLIQLGRAAEGLALLDELMVLVTSGAVSPLAAGDTYCALIEGCQETFDVRRGQEWTSVFSRWCADQPRIVAFRGQCMVYRAQIMELRGAWSDALEEVQRACRRLTEPYVQMAAAAAHYREGELYRLRGEFSRAEQAYWLASQGGRPPEPGLALLRLAQGDTSAAAAVSRRSLEENRDGVGRWPLLAAHVEIMLAAGDLAAARSAATELSELAASVGTPFLKAEAMTAEAAVLLAEGRPEEALPALRQAWRRWRELDIPYRAARVRVLIGLACRNLGDEDTAQMEFDAAKSAFQQLGAGPDLTRAETLAGGPSSPTPGGLTGREVEVLRLVAAGKTNRAIAAELFLSEKTVARHLSNIFVKLGVQSRAAATAYAYERQLV
jgi:DNA-binding CsgD family transcriptional regulator